MLFQLICSIPRPANALRFGLDSNFDSNFAISFATYTSIMKIKCDFLFSANERAYLIVKSVVRLSHPTAMDLVLRKRICFNVYKKHSLTDKIRRKMGHTSPLTTLGVLYEIVSNIPKVSFFLQ